ncbi:MAG TPA: TIR domain-containing protein, partial [Sphingomicrobium sp.]|nr:TIR domain-containing protein [Sphingomicrobium sp.]
MSDVFISYKAEDRRRVQLLVQALQADGLSVWWDEHIGTGDEWRQTIERQLDEAKCVIVIWSKRSVGPEGHFVRDEAARAQRRHVYVPVLIDSVDPPLGFGESQATSLRGWHGSASDPHYQAVLAAVRRSGGGKHQSTASPVRRSNIERRAVLAGGAVAVVAIAGVGGWALFGPGGQSASKSIAVLPFANLSSDPNQGFFSDGVAEEIRSALTRLPGLKVVGRTSSEAVRGDDAETAAKKLGVANILTGSVRQSPSTIRVSAELIDGRTGMDRWSQDYDRSPGDAIKIQTDIAQSVASALSTALGAAVRAAVSVGGTQNPEAQRLFIEAGALRAGPPSQPRLRQALKLLDSAIALDPNYAAAYARKSFTLARLANNYAGAQQLAQDRAETMRLAQMALKIAPNLSQAHQALGDVYFTNLQMAPGLAEMTRAVQLAPGDAGTLTNYAGLIASSGDTGRALSLLDQAIASDPLNPAPYNERILVLYAARRYRDVVNYAEQLKRNTPNLSHSSMTVGDAFVMLGRLREAQTFYNHAPPDYWKRLLGETVIAIRSGDRAAAQAKLARMMQTSGDAATYQYGEIYAQLGD